MKFLHCHSNFVPMAGPRFAFNGPSENPFVEREGAKIEAAKKAETVSEYDQTVDKSYYDGVIQGKVDERKANLEEQIDAELKAITDDDADKDAKRAALEAAKKNIPNKVAAYKSKLETARDASLGKISKAIEARNAEIKAEAEKYKDSVVLEMEAHDIYERQQHYNRNEKGEFVGDEWTSDNVESRLYNRFKFHQRAKSVDDSLVAKAMEMQQHDTNGRSIGDPETWERGQQLAMMSEAIQTIYEEEGKDAADAMVKTLNDKRLELGGERKQINWFVYDAAFQGGEGTNIPDMSIFKHVNDKMGAPLDKPKAYGHVLGKMYAADRYFAKHSAPEAFKAYQTYVRERIEDNDFMTTLNEKSDETYILSPAQWLKSEGSPEARKEVLKNPEKDRQKFVENIISKIDVDANGVEGDPTRLPLIQSALEGAMWGSDDPKEWDRIARQTLAKLMGGDFDSSKMNVHSLDISTFMTAATKEYGDKEGQVREMIGVKGMAYVAGLIEGAEQMYGKKDPEFLKDYKKFVREKFAKDGALMKTVRDQLAVNQANGVVLRDDPAAQEKMKDLLNDNIRAVYNYRNDLIQRWKVSGKPWDESSEKQRTLSNELYDRAMKHFEAGDFDQALYLFHKSYGQAESPSSLILIGQTYEKLGDKDNAKKAATSALKRARRLIEKDPSESNLVILKNAEDFARSQGAEVETYEAPLKKEDKETQQLLLVMTDHTASRTSPTLHRQAVSLKAAYEKAEDKQAWLVSNQEALDSLKKRMPKVLGWEKELGIVRKDSGEVEKDPTNAKGGVVAPAAAPAGQPSGSPKKGTNQGQPTHLEKFDKPVNVAKAEGVEKGDEMKEKDVPKPIVDKIEEDKGKLEPGLYVAKRGDERVVVEISAEDNKKNSGFFKPKEA